MTAFQLCLPDLIELSVASVYLNVKIMKVEIYHMDDSARPDSVDHILAEWATVRPDLDPLPIAIFARLLRVSGELGQSARSWLAEEGLTWEAFSLIVTLRRQGPPFAMRPGRILEESLLTSGAVTNRIDRVEKMGLVERCADPDDRRAVIVRLTSAGLARADAAIVRHTKELAVLLAPVDADALKHLDMLLSRVLAVLEDRGRMSDDAG
jgi:DNA-binding MarR family transcriptional regulator